MTDSALDASLAKRKLLEDKRRHAREDILRNEWGEDLNLVDDAKTKAKQGARGTQKLRHVASRHDSSHSLFAWTIPYRKHSGGQASTVASSASELDCELVSNEEARITCVSFAGHAPAVVLGDENGFLCLWRWIRGKWRGGKKTRAHDSAVMALDCVLVDVMRPLTLLFSSSRSSAVKVWRLTGEDELVMSACVETRLSSPSLCRSFLLSRREGEEVRVVLAVSSRAGETKLFLSTAAQEDTSNVADDSTMTERLQEGGGGGLKWWREMGELQGHKSKIVFLDIFYFHQYHDNKRNISSSIKYTSTDNKSNKGIITASLDGKVRIWSLTVSEDSLLEYRWDCLSCLDGIVNTSMQPQPFCTSEVLPGVLVAGERSHVQVWGLKLAQEGDKGLTVSMKKLDEKQEHVSDVSGLAARTDGFLILSSDNHGSVVVWMWEKEEGEEEEEEKVQLVAVRKMQVCSGSISALKFNRVLSMVSRLVLVCNDKLVKVLDTRRVVEVNEHTPLFLVDVWYPEIESSRALRAAKKDARYVQGRWNKDAHVDEKKRFYSMRENFSIALDSDLNLLFATVDVPDGAIRMWYHNFKKNKIKYSQDSSVCCMTVAKTSRNIFLVIGTIDGTIKLVDTSSTSPAMNMRGVNLKRAGAGRAHDAKITTLQASQDQPLLLSASLDGNIILWDLDSQLLRLHFTFHQDIRLASFSSSSLYCAFSSSPPADEHVLHVEKIHVYNLKHGTQVCSPLTRHASRVSCLSLDPRAGRSLASCAVGDHAVTVVHLEGMDEDGRDLPDVQLEGHEQDVTQILHDCTGCLLFSSSLDGDVRMWDPRTGVCLAVLRGKGQAVFNVALSLARGSSTSSSSHRMLAAVASSGEINVWDVEKRACYAVCTLKDFLTKQMEGRRSKLCNDLLGHAWYDEHGQVTSSPPHGLDSPTSSAVAAWMPYSHGRRLASLLLRVSLSDPLVEWERGRHRRKLMIQKRKVEQEQEQARLPKSKQKLMRFKGRRKEEEEAALLDPLSLEQSVKQRQQAVVHLLSHLRLSSPGHLGAKVALVRLLQAEDETLRSLGALGLGLLGNKTEEEELRKRFEQWLSDARRGSGGGEEEEEEEHGGGLATKQGEGDDSAARRKEQLLAYWQKCDGETKKLGEEENKCEESYKKIIETSKAKHEIETLLSDRADAGGGGRGGGDFTQESLRVEQHKKMMMMEETLAELDAQLLQLLSSYLELQRQHSALVDEAAIRCIALMLQDKSPAVVKCAICSLGFLCPPGIPSIIRLVLPSLSHPHDEIRDFAALCIGNLSRGASDSLVLLLHVVEAPNVSKDAILSALKAATFVLR
ncbi:hypothetical protein GUITHDRAFT_101038 [Guillardia theta CCMP2712]|uniref:Uncharacterized protein n=2 Tax=Guillardia theta TaxID=55529 RepID=L1JYB1_GUITC|nr:hypothetical protein GUITHDRAFT_101038 [Guillardia theta CCMP2712]EKX53337.1 hypothetical protein GUITHDRAFT_101038 [Guillardia theta CCMP2712]|eukprot:XP_005840317.1 hypothetical protein GUITHDRAFT_101038 [Guillardia theta CCMP2712]